MRVPPGSSPERISSRSCNKARTCALSVEDIDRLKDVTRDYLARWLASPTFVAPPGAAAALAGEALAARPGLAGGLARAFNLRTFWYHKITRFSSP